MAHHAGSWILSQPKIEERGNEHFAFLNLWPFAGVMMALLFLFLGLTSAHPHRYSGVDLAPVKHPVMFPLALREDAMNLHVTRDGTLFFNGHKVSVDDIPRGIHESIQSGAEKRVYLWVDARAKYWDAKVALDGVRDAGIERVALMVEKQRE